MQLPELIDSLKEKKVIDYATVEITGLSYDSRKVKRGYLFVAIPGFHLDGHDYIEDTVAKGATAVVVQGDHWTAKKVGIPVIIVPDTRKALAKLSAAFYGYPSQKLRVIGVTGTDGKTTTTYLINAVLEGAGYSTGLVGTVDFKIGKRIWSNETRQTTPESLEIQQMLAEMVGEGIDYAVIESTSHGLALERVTECDYDVAVFTNLSTDHLDFHQTQEQYLTEKAKLFKMLGEAHDKGIEKVSVLNADDATYNTLRAISPARIISYGVGNEAEVRAKNIRLSGLETSFTAVTPAGEIELKLKLPGSFNVYNSLAALAVALSQGVRLDEIKQALESISGIPGRMERIDRGQPFTVIVDYAHTPASLEKALNVVRPLTEGKLILVFGCAGERDKARRFGMGQVAGRLVDFSVLTNEDPRFEDPRMILNEIEIGLRTNGREEARDYIKVEDRREAINQALLRACPGDLVLLAGKGHERCIIIGNERISWDDRQVAKELLEKMA